MDNILQTAYSGAFSWMKMYEFTINNIPALVQIMAWRSPGDKPLSEPMMISLQMYICIIRPQWVNHSIMMLVRFGDLSQSDCSKWVMWQVKDPQPRPGWDWCLTWEKVAFIKCVKKLDDRDCKCGWPFRTASEIGRSPHLVAVTWKYKKLI